jgi:CAAX protease family protein
MMDSRLNTRRILIFLAFAFGISWATILAFYLTMGMDDPVKALTLANYVVIFTPALANVATRLITKEGWGRLWLRPNLRRGWRFYLAAWLLPFLAIIVGGAVYYLLFPQSFDPDLGALRKEFASFPPLAMFATVDNPWPLMLYIIVQFIILNVPIFAVQSFGEEFGWRSYLLPKLMERFSGARKAALLVGVIWGVWHWPYFFIQMTFDPGMHILYPLVYLVSTCSLSVLLSWATLRSGSVWPAAVGHGANNRAIALVATYPLKGLANSLLGPAPSGLIGGVGYLALALVLLFNRRAFAGLGDTGPEEGA